MDKNNEKENIGITCMCEFSARLWEAVTVPRNTKDLTWSRNKSAGQR
jgi:hypothetical protein